MQFYAIFSIYLFAEKKKTRNIHRNLTLVTSGWSVYSTFYFSSILHVCISSTFYAGFFKLFFINIEVPRLGFKSELQLPAYAMATATLDP